MSLNEFIIKVLTSPDTQFNVYIIICNSSVPLNITKDQ